jgi:hypothetical protein
MNHSCDYSASIAADKIFSKIKSPNKLIFKSYVPRSIYDMNRIQSRQTDFRRNIRNRFSEVDLLFDIHSFPFSKDYPLFWNEVFIIDDTPGFTELSRGIFNILKRSGFKCELISGSGVNDITNEAKNSGIDSILIECNEDLSERRMNQLTSIIADCINKLLSGK